MHLQQQPTSISYYNLRDIVKQVVDVTQRLLVKYAHYAGGSTRGNAQKQFNTVHRLGLIEM